MSLLNLVFVLSVLIAMGHSLLSERLHLRPMRRRAREKGQTDPTWIRLSTLMYHFPSLLWVVLAGAMCQLDPGETGTPAILALFGSVYALSGIGNLWATRRPHPGGLLLLSVAGLVFYVFSQLPDNALA